jgi:hypothetical protein
VSAAGLIGMRLIGVADRGISSGLPLIANRNK